jgi:hypothetical protein
MALARSTWAVRSRAILHHLQPSRRASASAAAAAAKPLPDPHNVSHSLDAETSARIVDRLESRGQDEIFRSLFLGYFAELRSCKNVLEIGCGTVWLRSRLIMNHEARMLPMSSARSCRKPPIECRVPLFSQVLVLLLDCCP